MRELIRVVGALVVVCALTSTLGGCTVTGMGIGAIVDHSKKQEITPRDSELKQISEGERIKVTLTDRTKLQGEFLNYSQPDSSLIIKSRDEPKGTGEFTQTIIQGEVLRVPLKFIHTVEFGMTNSGKTIGALAGALVDVGIIIAFQHTKMGP
jgi:hypothetical protein